MKALLVHPFHTYSSHLIYSSEPIGLLYLATYAEEQTEWDIEILDLYALGGGKRERSGEVFHFGLSDEHQIGRLIKASQADLVGISCNFTNSAQDSTFIASIARECLPNKRGQFSLCSI